MNQNLSSQTLMPQIKLISLMLVRSMSVFANKTTLVVTFLLTPLLSLILYMSFGAAFGEQAAVNNGLAGLSITAALTSMTVLSSTTMYDRIYGALPYVVFSMSKTLVWAVRSLCAMAFSCISGGILALLYSVVLLSTGRSVPVGGLLLALVASSFSGAGVGLLLAFIGIIWRDSSMVGNIATSVIIVFAGSTGDISKLSPIISVLTTILPGRFAAQYVRGVQESPHSLLWAAEFLVGSLWLMLAVVFWWLVISRGKKTDSLDLIQ